MTRRTIVTTLALLLTLAAAPAFAQSVRLAGRLNGGEEAPNKVLTGAVGVVSCRVDLGRRFVTCEGSVFNLPGGVTAGHIHVGSIGVAGPVVCNATLPIGASNDFDFTIFCDATNISLRSAQGINSIDDFLQTLVGEGAYVNIHTSANPAGEIRGQLLLEK